ncbi:8188_t:CDS:2, partial [Paraglomus occultum]
IELGNYVRGDEIFHYGAAAIYLVSLSIGTFVISYVKIKWPTMRFGSVYALIVIVFSLSTAYIQPAMSKIMLRNLAIPMFIGPVISLVVNQLLWPEHGTTNYIPHLIETLHNFNALLKHETSFFLRNTYNKSIIYSLQKKTQKNLMNLQNVKRESLHEISYSKIGPVDLIEIAKIIKQMHMPLDGLALSGMIEEQLAYDDDNDIPEVRIDFLDENASYIDDDEPPPSPTGNTRDFQRLLEIIRPNCTDLAKACQICLEDCASRIAHLRHDCNPSWQFWCKGCNKDDIKNLLPDPMAVMSDALEKFHDARNEGLQNLFIENETISPSPQRLVLLLLLFEHNLEEFAVGLQVLIGLVKHLESSRVKKQLWWPPMPFLKRIQVRKTVAEGTWKVVEPDPRIDDDMGEGEDDFCDPDVRVPHTKSQIFWYRLWKIRNWLGGKYVRFAMKNTLIVTLLMLPCFLPSTSSTFQSLRAQWAVITAILAFWPTTGGAILQFICRICGSLIGAGLAIIAWLVTGGNPIGLAAALFFISLFLWFIFHNTRMWTVGSVIMLITFPLILGNEYQNVHGIGHFDEDIFLLAGKRTLAVATGIFTAFIMTVLPWPHTGRVEIRHRLARTISQVGVLYSMTIAFFLKDDSSPCAHTTKAFRKLLTRIQRSTNTERLLLSRTKYEPPLRGDFPRDLYEEMIDVVEHMTCIIARMAHTLTGLDEEWKENLRNVLKRPSKRYYVTHILVAFHILSNALERRSPLPPYSIAPKKVSRAGIKFWSKVKTLDELTEEQLTRPAYACYCSYLIKTGHLGNELIKLVDVMRQLVGIN